MHRNTALICFLAAAAITALLLTFSQPATCNTCIGPCGVDANCDTLAGCRCFVPTGQGVGRCG